MQDEIPIPIYTSEEEPIILRTPGSTRLNCIYDIDNHIFIFSIVGNTGPITVSICNLNSNERINTVFIGSGHFYVPISGDAGSWQIIITLDNEYYFGGVEL